MTMNDKAKEALESMIDAYGLRDVLSTLSDICAEKAEHIQCNWQDEHTAKTWESDAASIRRIVTKVHP